MSVSEPRTDHLDPHHLSGRMLLAVVSALAVIAVALNVVMLSESAPIVLVSAADVFMILSAFLAGNMYRLSDIRARAGLQARLAGKSQAEVLATLTPLKVVQFRFKISIIGFCLAAVMLLASFLSVRWEATSLRPLVAAAVLGIAASAVSFLCGLWSRPID